MVSSLRLFEHLCYVLARAHSLLRHKRKRGVGLIQTWIVNRQHNLSGTAAGVKPVAKKIANDTSK